MKKEIQKAIKDAIIAVSSCTEFWRNPSSVEIEVDEIVKKLEGAKTIVSETEQLAELEIIAIRIGVLWQNENVLEDSSGGLASAMDYLNEVIEIPKI